MAAGPTARTSRTSSTAIVGRRIARAVPHSLFASARGEPRRRRVDDAVVLGVAVATVLATAPAVGERTVGAAEVVDAFDRLLGWLDPLWPTGYAGASVLCVVLLAAAVISRRMALLRDIVLAAGTAYAAGDGAHARHR